MKKNILIITLLFFYANMNAQTGPSKINRFSDFTATAGKSQGSVAASFVNNWKFGKKKRLEAGLGLRWTSYFGTKTDFITAPAKLARTTTTPFIIFFAGQREENFDTLTVQRPFTNSVNITINLGYNFTEKFNAGFNIDLVGFTFGRKSSAILTSNGNTKFEAAAKPTSFNVLLTGDNDYGTLNSEFFLKYKLNKKWGIKAVYQFLFIEYKTNTVNQIAADGTIVNRFRNKANNFGAGVSYNL